MRTFQTSIGKIAFVISASAIAFASATCLEATGDDAALSACAIRLQQRHLSGNVAE